MLGGASVVAACVPMVAMLPAGAAGAFSLVGLGAGGGAVAALSPALSPIARPLLLASTALVAVSHLRCSRLAVASSAAGGTLLYLAMFAITQPDGRSQPALFYPGLALFAGSYLIPIARRRLETCRPVIAPGIAKALLLATILAGAAAVASAAAFRGATRPTRPHAAATRTHARATGHATPARTSMHSMSIGQ